MNIIICPIREAYSTDQIKDTMSVNELKKYLDRYDNDAKVFVSFDGGYSYGRLTEDTIKEQNCQY